MCWSATQLRRSLIVCVVHRVRCTTHVLLQGGQRWNSFVTECAEAAQRRRARWCSCCWYWWYTAYRRLRLEPALCYASGFSQPLQVRFHALCSWLMCSLSYLLTKLHIGVRDPRAYMPERKSERVQLSVMILDWRLLGICDVFRADRHRPAGGDA